MQAARDRGSFRINSHNPVTLWLGENLLISICTFSGQPFIGWSREMYNKGRKSRCFDRDSEGIVFGIWAGNPERDI